MNLYQAQHMALVYDPTEDMMGTDYDREPTCDGDAHVWTSRNGKPIIEGDKCDCGEATWTDPEIPEARGDA